MSAFVLLAVPLSIAGLAYLAGRRYQAFSAARADVRDQRVKLRKARRAQVAAAGAALVGWSVLAVGLLLVAAAVVLGT